MAEVSEPDSEPDGIPTGVLAAIRAQLGNGEQLVWAGRPRLRACFKQLLVLYPMCAVFGVALAVAGWFFYSWAARAGALGFKNLVFLALMCVVSLGLLVVPLLWPVRLWRSWYALTTGRVILRVPRFLVFWPRPRDLDATRVGEMRVRTFTFLPDGIGDITWGYQYTADGGGRLQRNPGGGVSLELVPHAEYVADLIRRTLVGSRSNGATDGEAAGGSVSG